MRANIEGDAQLVVESLKAKEILAENGEYGTYPVNFAEIEAYDLLAEEMENFNEGSLEKADARLQTVISDLILFGKLEGIAKL